MGRPIAITTDPQRSRGRHVIMKVIEPHRDYYVKVFAVNARAVSLATFNVPVFHTLIVNCLGVVFADRCLTYLFQLRKQFSQGNWCDKQEFERISKI